MPTVLLIDDALDQLDLYEMALQDAGYATLAATRGGVGYNVAVTDAPDVIIAELGLPDVDGWELCAWLKANPITTAIPMIILTARNDYEIPLRALNANVSDLLSKPCSVDRLTAAIEGALGDNGRRHQDDRTWKKDSSAVPVSPSAACILCGHPDTTPVNAASDAPKSERWFECRLCHRLFAVRFVRMPAAAEALVTRPGYSMPK